MRIFRRDILLVAGSGSIPRRRGLGGISRHLARRQPAPAPGRGSRRRSVGALSRRQRQGSGRHRRRRRPERREHVLLREGAEGRRRLPLQDLRCPTAACGLPPTSSTRSRRPPNRSPSTTRKRARARRRIVVEVKNGGRSRGGGHEDEELGIEPGLLRGSLRSRRRDDGTIIGIIEVYVDQSAKREAFQAKIAGVAISLAAIIAIAFGLPALGFYWRTRQKQQAEFARRVSGAA